MPKASRWLLSPTAAAGQIGNSLLNKAILGGNGFRESKAHFGDCAAFAHGWCGSMSLIVQTQKVHIIRVETDEWQRVVSF